MTKFPADIEFAVKFLPRVFLDPWSVPRNLLKSQRSSFADPFWQPCCIHGCTPITYAQEARNVGKMPLRFSKAPIIAIGVTSLLCVGAPFYACTTAAPNKPAQSEDASAREIVEFNRFLQGHQEVPAIFTAHR
jgi:hypothetical protein